MNREKNIELKFLVQVDSKPYKEKPSGSNIARIKTRVQGGEAQELTAMELANLIEKGVTFSLGILKGGLKAENWIEQQLFGIDIDNEENSQPILTPKVAVDTCKQRGINPIIFYTTFSNTKEKPKFRIIFALDKPVKDQVQREIIMETLISLFPQADKSCKNADRLFFGTNQEVTHKEQVTSIEKILELHKNFTKDTAPVDLKKFETELETLKENFDFESYLTGTLGLKVENRSEDYIYFEDCPICGHKNCFRYYPKTKTFYCFGQNGSKGGTIINFLMLTKNLSKSDAINYFKKELCHMLDKSNNTGGLQDKKLKIISVANLMASNYKEPYYCVENLIYQGLTIVAAQPKFGKSWFVNYMCLCVANGQEFLGFKTQKCKTLYIDLEDSKPRLNKRLKKILDGESAPENFDVTLEAFSIQEGLIQSLENYIKNNNDVKLIVIDTLQKVRSDFSGNNRYEADYRTLGTLKSFADKHSLCIVIVHHLKKQTAKNDHIFSQISGTNGIMGAVDTMLVFENYDKESSEATLHITGRDIESDELLLQFDKNNCRWLCLGNAEVQAQRREEKYYEDSVLVNSIKRMLKQEHTWSGTATELKNTLVKYGGDCDMAVSVMAKELKKLKDLFFKYDNVTYTPAPTNGSNGSRVHKFESKGFQTIADIDDLFE